MIAPFVPSLNQNDEESTKVNESKDLTPNGNYLFQNFENLGGDKKALCAYGLCGILDLANDLPIGQSSLLAPCQWSYLKKEFKSKKLKHLPKLSESLEKVISEVEKVLYIYCLSLYDCLFIYIHIFVFI